MKKYVILFLLASLWFGCSKDTIEKYDPNTSEQPNQPYDYAEFYGYHVSDITGFDLNSIKMYVFNNSTWLLGIKNNNLWFGLFDTNSKEQIEEWNGTIQVLNNQYSIIESPYNLSEGYIIFTENNECISSFLLYNSKAIYLKDYNTNILSNYDFTIKEFDKEVLVYHPTIHGSIYSMEGKELVNSVSMSSTDSKDYYLSGFVDNKVWFGVCTNNSIEKQYTANEDYDRNIKINLGYGEYEDYYVDAFVFDDFWGRFAAMDWGYIFAPIYGDNYKLVDMFICKDGNIERMLVPSYFTLHEWYNGSFLIYQTANGSTGTNIYSIYSSDAELIIEHEKPQYGIWTDPFRRDIPPVAVSYTEYIYQENWGGELRIRRYKLSSDVSNPVWSNIVTEIPDNSIDTWQILESNENSLLYQIDILNYDGSEEQIKFEVNINTGEIKML